MPIANRSKIPENDAPHVVENIHVCSCDAQWCADPRTPHAPNIQWRTVSTFDSCGTRIDLRSPVDASNRTSYTLSPELIVEASRRLGWLGLVYASALIATYLGRRALLAWTGPVGTGIHFAHLLPTVMMGIAVYAVSRSGILSPKRLLDLGLVFEVAGAFGIAAVQLWAGVPRLSDASFPLIPGECVWIVAYPLVVPNTPRKVLAASILAASMGPAILAMASAASGTAIHASLVLGYCVLPNYLSAAIAYAVAHIVHQFSARLKHAREIGSYELIEPLGEGGMGEVWRAKHRLLARPAAIKLIRTQVLGSSQRTRDAMVRRFEREAQETAMLGSPHTIDVYDFGVNEEGDFYYVMELLDGISLERFVQVFGPMESGTRRLPAAPDLPLPRRSALARPDPSRHQASQHLHVPTWPRRRFRQGARFRPRQACRPPRAARCSRWTAQQRARPRTWRPR